MAVVIVDLDDTLIPDVIERDRALTRVLDENGSRVSVVEALTTIRKNWHTSRIRDVPQLTGVSSWEALWTDFTSTSFSKRDRVHGINFQRRTWSSLVPARAPEAVSAEFRACREAAVAAYVWVEDSLSSLGASYALGVRRTGRRSCNGES